MGHRVVVRDHRTLRERGRARRVEQGEHPIRRDELPSCTKERVERWVVTGRNDVSVSVNPSVYVVRQTDDVTQPRETLQVETVRLAGVQTWQDLVQALQVVDGA